MRTVPLGLGWSSLWGYETLSWVGETHANCATGAFGGAPYGSTKRGRGVQVSHAAAATGAFGGAPYVTTKRVRGTEHIGSSRNGMEGRREEEDEEDVDGWGGGEE